MMKSKHIYTIVYCDYNLFGLFSLFGVPYSNNAIFYTVEASYAYTTRALTLDIVSKSNLTKLLLGSNIYIYLT